MKNPARTPLTAEGATGGGSRRGSYRGGNGRELVSGRRNVSAQAAAVATVDLIGHAGDRLGAVGAGGDDPVVLVDVDHPGPVLGDLGGLEQEIGRAHV